MIDFENFDLFGIENIEYRSVRLWRFLITVLYSFEIKHNYELS